MLPGRESIPSKTRRYFDSRTSANGLLSPMLQEAVGIGEGM